MLPGGLHAAQFLQKYFEKYLRNASDNLTNTNTMRRNAVYSGIRKDSTYLRKGYSPTYSRRNWIADLYEGPPIDQPNTATAPVLLFLKLHFCIKVIGRLQTLLQKKSHNSAVVAAALFLAHRLKSCRSVICMGGCMIMYVSRRRIR